MQPEKLQRLSEMFTVLGHPKRLRIFKHMMTDPFGKDEPQVPTLVATELNLTVPTTGYSMKRMAEAGVLTRKVSGRYTFYSIDPNFLTAMKEFFS